MKKLGKVDPVFMSDCSVLSDGVVGCITVTTGEWRFPGAEGAYRRVPSGAKPPRPSNSWVSLPLCSFYVGTNFVHTASANARGNTVLLANYVA